MDRCEFTDKSLALSSAQLSTMRKNRIVHLSGPALVVEKTAVSLIFTFVLVASVLLGGCVSAKSQSRGEDVTVLMLRNVYFYQRSGRDQYYTFQDTGVRVDGGLADKMYRIVASVQSEEAQPCFCGIVGHQLFLRNGKPDVLVELLVHDVAIIGKVTRMNILPGGYYIVSEERGRMPWKTFKSKWYAEAVRESLNLQKNSSQSHECPVPEGGRE